MNPGTLTRNLPDQTHLVYGSYDSSYRSQVTDRKADVEQRLNADEEEAWQGRIHYLDLDLSGATGDLGEALSALGEPTTLGRPYGGNVAVISTGGAQSDSPPLRPRIHAFAVPPRDDDVPAEDAVSSPERAERRSRKSCSR